MTARTDLAYGRGGGRYAPMNPGVDLNGPRCEMCGQPMVLGQRSTHFLCTPPAECCSWPTGLLGPKHTHETGL